MALDGTAANAKIAIAGQDHDDTPVGVKRHVNAIFSIKDYNGELWRLDYGRDPYGSGALRSPGAACMVVERLPETEDGRSQWAFYTEATPNGEHWAYLYRHNREPHAPTEFWGMVDFPLSGLIVSLTPEPAPIDDGSYVHPEGEGCPPALDPTELP